MRADDPMTSYGTLVESSYTPTGPVPGFPEYRRLTSRGAFNFCVPLLLDVGLAAAAAFSACLTASTWQSRLFLILWGLRAFAWLYMYVWARYTAWHMPFSLLGIATIISVHLIPCGVPAIGFVSAYAVYIFQFFFFCFYPDDWAEGIAVALDKRVSSLTPQQLAHCSPFAPPDTLHEGRVGKPFWVQEFGNPAHDVIVVLAGMPCGSIGMGPTITPFLLCEYFVALIEYPGAGNGRYEKFDLNVLQERVKKYVTEIQPNPNKPVRVYGVSGGGNAAIFIASKLPESVAAVVSVVGVAPENKTFGMSKNRSVFWHPLSFKCKMEARAVPASVPKGVVSGELAKFANSIASDSLDDTSSSSPNLKLGADVPIDDSLSLQDYFHHPQLLQQEYFGERGPGSSPGYKAKMQAVSDQVHQWIGRGADWDLLYCGEIYSEYVEQYCVHDMESVVSGVQCPILFVGGEGDAASANYDSWARSLPGSTPYEIVMAQIINAGTGGLNAHGHSTNYWARHALLVKRFLTKAKGLV